MFFLMFAVFRLLVFTLTSNTNTVNKSPASAKARNTENRVSNMINNGFSTGGPVVVNATVTANSVNPQGQHRANFSWTPNTHLGGSGTTWENGAQARINDLIDQLSNVSDRCDYLNTQLINANVAVN